MSAAPLTQQPCRAHLTDPPLDCGACPPCRARAALTERTVAQLRAVRLLLEETLAEEDPMTRHPRVVVNFCDAIVQRPGQGLDTCGLAVPAPDRQCDDHRPAPRREDGPLTVVAAERSQP